MRHKLNCIILLLMVTLMLPGGLYAQQTFQKAFYNSTSDNFNVKKVIATNDGGALVLAENGIGVGAIPVLLKLNKDFEPEWKKNVFAGFEEYMIINDIVQISNGTYVYTGSVVTVTDKQFVIYAIDQDGNRRWGFRSGVANLQEEGKVIEYKDGAIYVAGESNSISAPPSEFFITKYDTIGNQIGQDFLVNTFQSRVVDMKITDAGEAHIAATIPSGPNANPVLLKADANVKFVYQEVFQLPGLNSASALILTPNSIVLMGTDNNNLNGRFFATIIPYLFTSNDAFTTVFFDFGVDVNLMDVIKNQSSGFIFCGEVNDGSKTCLNMRANLNESLGTFDVLWAITYGDDENQGFTSLDVTSTNFIVSAGTSAGYVPGVNSIYVCKSFSTGFTGCRENTVNANITIKNVTTHNLVIPAPGQLGDFSATVALLLPTNDFDLSFQNACDEAPPHSDFGFTNPLCEDSCVTFTNNSSFGETFEWTFNGASINNYSGLTPPEICYNTPGSFDITLIVTNQLGADTTTKTITIHPTPDIKTANDTIVCEGNTFALTASGGDSYEWSGYNPDDIVLSPDNIIPAATHTYYVKGTGVGGCTAIDSIKLTLINKPSSVGFDSIICKDSTIILSAKNNGFNYTWSTGSNKQSIIATETGTVTVNVSNICFDEQYQFNVEVEDCTPTMFTPTAFRPNGDGINDSFSILGNNITVYELEIFNRWGEKIFEGSAENNFTWDGTYKEEPVQSGLYMYIAKVQYKKGKRILVKGTIYLLK